ncbi:MAG: C39 family peptidase [Anaerolineae bacterium]
MAFRPVPYSQNDPTWKNNLLGPGPDTIGWIGCTMTCLAMYASGWGYPETPASMNQKLASHGGYTADELLVWTAVTQFIPQIRYRSLMFCNDTTNHVELINAELARGNPVIVEVDFAPDATLQTHWVLLYARKPGEDDYLMLDPYPCPPETQPASIMSRYGHGMPLKRVIRAAAFYDCVSAGTSPDPTSSTTPTTTPTTTPSTPPAPPVPATPPSSSTTTTPLPTPVTTDLVVQVLAEATAGIKLHDAPSMDSFASYAEMPGVRLNVIEPKAGALAKLGQSNQWVFVRDPNGHQGFVAAWFVQAVSAPAVPPTSTPATPPSTPSAPATPPASPGPSTQSTPPASGPERMQVQVISAVGIAGLSVRQQPSLGATMVNVEKAGARLTVVEPLEGARAKIGQPGQWLAVKATNNKRGYVMAQYVQLR